MRRNLLVCFALLAASFASSLSAANVTDRKALTLAGAKAIAAASEAEAVKNKWTVVIAILDEGGNLLYLERMDGTQIGSVEVAIQKAKSAFLFKRPSKVFSDAVGGGRVGIMSLPGAMPVEGGLPITVDGQVIGAIGVSGMTSEQDGMIGAAGLKALQ